MTDLNHYTVDSSHLLRFREQCEKEYKPEADLFLSESVIHGRNKQLLLMNRKNMKWTEIIRADGSFVSFPGIEYNDGWFKHMEKPPIANKVQYEVLLRQLANNHFLFVWEIQEAHFDPGDSMGFGMEIEYGIWLYSYLNESGDFTAPFRIYSVENYLFYTDGCDSGLE